VVRGGCACELPEAEEKMSLIQVVVALIEEAGSASADDLMPDCPGYSRAQVLSAIQNAAQLGHIVKVGKAGTGLGNGLGIYEPVPKPAGPRPVASVWEFAQREANAA